MAMDLTLMLVLFAIGFIGSFLSGMLGVGGSIIKYPMLLYIPPLFGLTAFTAHEASGISAVQVLFASIAGIWAYRKGGYLHKPLIIYMGGAIFTGSLIGSYGSIFFSEQVVNVVYGLLAGLAAVMMFVPKKHTDDMPLHEVDFHKPLAAMLAFIVGAASGIVGAAGGFLLVPILLTVLHIPTRITIATSLAVTFISSIGGSAGKLITGQVDIVSAMVMVAASLLAAPLGAAAGKRMNTKMLRILLALLIAASTVKIWVDVLTAFIWTE